MIILKTKAWSKLLAACHVSPNEVSGLGYIYSVANEEDGTVTVKVGDLWYLADGNDSAGETDLDPKAVAKLQAALDKAGVDLYRLRVWWHKHPISGWSGTDDRTIKSGMGLDLSWMVSLAWTPRGLIGRYDILGENPKRIDMPVVFEGMDIKAADAIKEEIAQAQKKRIYVPKAQAAWTGITPTYPTPLVGYRGSFGVSSAYVDNAMEEALLLVEGLIEQHLEQHHGMPRLEAIRWVYTGGRGSDEEDTEDKQARRYGLEESDVSTLQLHRATESVGSPSGGTPGAGDGVGLHIEAGEEFGLD